MDLDIEKEGNDERANLLESLYDNDLAQSIFPAIFNPLTEDVKSNT